MQRWFGLLLACLVAFAASPADAQERITRFLSEARIEPDGTLDVTETISLPDTGWTIRHGIQRDLLTRFRDASGRRIRAEIDVVEVLRNGHDEPYALRREGNLLRVRVGDAAVRLEPGPQVYRLRYRATRMIGFLPGHDELYWNVTGHGWSLPIDEVEARITLAEPTRILNHAFHTGPAGAAGQAASFEEELPGRLVFRTTRRLGPREGLTVTVAWPKGQVAEPPVDRVGRLAAGLALCLLLAATLAVIGHDARLWWRGWRRRRQPVPPRAEPPTGLSPAAAGYVWHMGLDSRVFAAALIDCTMRGAVTLEAAEGETLDHRARALARSRPELVTEAPEHEMLEGLFHASHRVEITPANGAALRQAEDSLRRGLALAYAGPLFRPRLYWALRHLTWIAAAELLAALLLPPLPAPWLVLLVLLPWPLAWAAHRRGARLPARLAMGLGAALGLAMVVRGFLQDDGALLLLPVLAVPAIILGAIFLRDHTPRGWEVRREIEGLRRHLGAAAEQGSEASLEEFRRLAPYAIALGLGNEWSARFAGELEEARNADLAVMAASEPFVIDLFDATTPPPSAGPSHDDGGSSGGGSSGGGSGGGGGSGW